MFKGVPLEKAAAIRVVVFLFAWLNQFLVTNDFQPLPVLGEAEVAAIFVFGASLLALVKDNRLRKKDEPQAK